jgi:energy-coupling factor transporter ATP-binding protein EcfA2
VNKAWRALEPDPLEGMADSPYPGLRPFLPRERDIFFGREQMVDQVLVRLNERHMVVVHGASGCGKSSLIAAGVLPQLARRRARRGLVLRTGTFRPGVKPMQALVGLLQELCATEAGPAGLEDVYRAIANGPEARAGVARLAAAAGIDQICIVVDQFEELFRFAEDEGFEEAQRFAELLVQLCGCYESEASWWEAEAEGEAAEPDKNAAEISFILTMRSEFLGNCARYRGLAEAINHTQYLLPNMARADLVRAIREPAEVFEGSVDHALAERMADDAAREQDALPLVQHALMQMWRATGDRTLDLKDYERALEACALSEQERTRVPLSAILAGHADRVLAEVSGGDAARESATEFIFRALTRKDSESRAIRCPQRFWRLARLSGVSWQETVAIVDGFRREGVSFLTPYAEMDEEIEGETVIDISHEALIRAWPQMSDKAIDAAAQPVGWVEREAQDAMLWRWLSVHALFFETNRKAYLDGATSERLGAWFERIRQRPDWARAHLVRPTGTDDVTDEPEWRGVARLLKESHDKTWLDRTMLRRWRKLGWSSLAVLLLVIAGVGFGGYRLILAFRGEAQSLRRTAIHSTIETVLPQIPCSWLEIDALRDDRRLAASIRGGAGFRTNARHLIEEELVRANLPDVRVDFRHVTKISPSPTTCAMLHAYRQIRANGVPRMTTSQPPNAVPIRNQQPMAATAAIELNTDGVPDFALIELHRGAPARLLFSSRAEFMQKRLEAGSGISDRGNGRYRLDLPVMADDWTAVIFITGHGPFDPSMLGGDAAVANNRGWQAEMVWFDTTDR